MTQQQYNQKIARLVEIQNLVKSEGYQIEFDETDGARLYKQDDFVHVEHLDSLVKEYEQIRFETDAAVNEFDGSLKCE